MVMMLMMMTMMVMMVMMLMMLMMVMTISVVMMTTRPVGGLAAGNLANGGRAVERNKHSN